MKMWEEHILSEMVEMNRYLKRICEVLESLERKVSVEDAPEEPHNPDETSFTKKPSTLNREKLVFK